MYFDGDENYQRGYEWWMMKEAKKVTNPIDAWHHNYMTHADSYQMSLKLFLA